MGESRAFMMYLVNKYKPDNEHLYPRDPEKRAPIEELIMFYEIGTYYQASYKLFYPLQFDKKDFDVENEMAYKDVLQHLDKKPGENETKRFMLGNNLTIADISFAASFSMAHACGYNFHEFKHLFAYSEHLKSAIPNYREIN